MKLLVCLLACLCLVACGGETEEKKADVAEQAPAKEQPAAAEEMAGHTHAAAVADMAVELATRNASCGCAIKEIGHCGNYVEIDSKWIGIGNEKELGLGGMEWCGKEGVQVETAGEIKDGKFIAASLVVK